MKILFNILIFALPLGVLTRFNPFPGVYIYLHDVVTFLIFLLLTFKIIKGEGFDIKNKLFVLASLFALSGFISLILNFRNLSFNEFLISSAYLLRWVSYAGLIFALGFLPKDYVRNLHLKLILAGILFTFFGFIQYLLYPDLRNLFYLGWDEHLYRLFSTFLDPNFAGAFLVLVFVLVGEKIMSELHFPWSKSKLRDFILLLLILIAIMLTYSRSAFIMLLVTVATLLFLRRKYKFVLVSFILFIGVYFLFSNRSIEGLNPFRVVSAEARIISAGEAIEIISQNPLLGVGFNAYRYAQIRHGTRTGEYAYISNADAGTDNSFLFVLATTGVVGFLFYVGLLAGIIKSSFENKKNPMANVVIASTVGLMVNSMFINSLFYAPIMVWLFIIAGIMGNKKR